LLLAEGLEDTVEDLKVFPGKAGRLGCAIVRARGVADVERLAKTFHGRQFGSGSPIAVSFVAPGGLHGSAQFGAPPIKVPSLGAMPVKIQSTLSTAKQPTSPSTSPSLVPGSITLIQSVPDLALSADLGVLKESRAASNGIHRVDTASSLASSLATERQSLQSISCGNSPRGSLFSSSADSNCDEDCILEASYLRPPPPGRFATAMKGNLTTLSSNHLPQFECRLWSAVSADRVMHSVVDVPACFVAGCCLLLLAVVGGCHCIRCCFCS